MAAMAPYSQLTGVLKVYIAPYGEPEPNINATPARTGRAGADRWRAVDRGHRPADLLHDNSHISDVKGVRARRAPHVSLHAVGLTLEQVARIKANVSEVISTTMNGANVKRLPAKMGYTPRPMRCCSGDADSPYGVLPGQRYVPYGVFEGEHT
jgi:hypothetical protein